MPDSAGKETLGARPSFAFFLPLAAPQRPVGYARIWVGAAGEEAQRLPLDNFDVGTVGEAWSALVANSLWPVVSPRGTLYWQPVFMGSPEEVAAGRSKGKSAHLTVLLAVAAWDAGRASCTGEDAEVHLWASGELDFAGNLLPVESLAHKLRLFLVHASNHAGRSLFLAPAANRATVDVVSLGGETVEERLFSPELSLESLPPGATVVWVNRGDVRQLLAWIAGDPGPAGRDGDIAASSGGKGAAQAGSTLRRPPARRFVFATAGLLLLLLAAVLLLPRSGDDSRGGLPPALQETLLALSLSHHWSFSPGRVAREIAGARTIGEAVVWEEELASYNAVADGRYGDDRLLPDGVKLIGVLDRFGYHLGVQGPPARALAVLGLLDHDVNQLRLPKGTRFGDTGCRRRLFDPRRTVLFSVMAAHYLRLAAAGVIDDGPANKKEFYRQRFRFYNGLGERIHVLYATVACCSIPVERGLPGSPFNSFCPLSSAQVPGRALRGFKLDYQGRRHSYLAALVGGDSARSGSVLLDGRQLVASSGAFRHGAHLLDEYPRHAELRSQSRGVTFNAELVMVVAAAALWVDGYWQEPAKGLSGNLPPVVNIVPAGVSYSPSFVFFEGFDEGRKPPWSKTEAQVEISRGRLRLFRDESQWGMARFQPARELPRRWELSAVMELATAASSLDACVYDDSWGEFFCLTLNNETLNGSRPGVHVLCDAKHDNLEIPADRELGRYRFDPGRGVARHLRLQHLPGGRARLFVDGRLRDEFPWRCRVHRADRLELSGGQDSRAGHGGWFDDVLLAGWEEDF